jgi:hypothetical protein
MTMNDQGRPGKPDKSQAFSNKYETGTIIAIQIQQTGKAIDQSHNLPVQWVNDFVVRVSMQIKNSVYTGEYVTQDQSLAPPHGWENNQPIEVKIGRGKMFLRLAAGSELVANLSR